MIRPRPAAFWLLAVLLPLALEALLRFWIAAGPSAALMLGAVNGASHLSLATMAGALLLRIYCLVALPGVIVYGLVVAIGGRRPGAPDARK